MEPQTAAGRALLEHMIEDASGFVTLTSGRFSIKWVLDALAKEIPLIEQEARAAAERDVAALREALGRVMALGHKPTTALGDPCICAAHDNARALLANPAAAEPKP